MKNEKEPSPFAVLWGWAKGYHAAFAGAVVLAVLGVACGMGPYFCVAAILRLLLNGGSLSECLLWCPGRFDRICRKGAVFHIVYGIVPHCHIPHIKTGEKAASCQTEPGSYGNDFGYTVRSVQDDDC